MAALLSIGRYLEVLKTQETELRDLAVRAEATQKSLAATQEGMRSLIVGAALCDRAP